MALDKVEALGEAVLLPDVLLARGIQVGAVDGQAAGGIHAAAAGWHLQKTGEVST